MAIRSGVARWIPGMIASGLSISVTRAPGFVPKTGDGTSQITLGVFGVLSWVLNLGGWIWLSRWAVNHGLRHEMDPVLLAIDFVVAILVSVLFHELGHVAGEWASESRVFGLRVGPFTWKRVAGRSRFQFDLSKLLGGATSYAPSKASDMAGQSLFVTAAGPVGSLLFGSVCMLLFVTAVGRPWQSGWRLLEMLAVFCLADALCNLVPVGGPNGVYSDGATLWQLARGGTCARHLEFKLYRALSLTTTQSPAEWPSAQVEEAVQFASSPHELMRERVFAIAHYRTKCDAVQTERHLAELMTLAQNHTPKEVEWFASEIAFQLAFFAERPLDAREWLNRSQHHLDDFRRAEAAVLAVEGDLGSARESWERAWGRVSESPVSGYRLLDEMDLTAMAERWFPDLIDKANALRRQSANDAFARA